jgi:hypothetical protein
MKNIEKLLLIIIKFRKRWYWRKWRRWRKKIAERQLLYNADLDEIVDFFQRVVKNVKEDIASEITWENLIKIPILEDNIKITENAINEDIEIIRKLY